METPVFSIVIPVYKTEAYLSRCVSSAIGQTFSPIEILLVDDGSPDGCPGLCDGFARQDPRVKVIHKANGGLSDARNWGIAAATGEYILLLDSDDYLEADACQRLAPAAKTGCDCLVGKWIRDDGPAPETGNDFLKLWQAEDYLEAALSAGHMSMAAVLYLYRREFLQKNDLTFKKGIRHEDDHFTPRALLKAKTVAQTDVPFYRYILRADSITTQQDLRQNAKDLQATCRELRELYNGLDNRKLAALLTDTLAMQQLSLSQQGRLYRYGREYCFQRQILGNARRPKTVLKALLYCVSPGLYWHINHWSKAGKR